MLAFYLETSARRPQRLAAMEFAEIQTHPWRMAQQPTPVFWPGESHRQRSLAGQSPWGRTESDVTGHFTTHYFTVHFHFTVLVPGAPQAKRPCGLIRSHCVEEIKAKSARNLAEHSLNFQAKTRITFSCFFHFTIPPTPNVISTMQTWYGIKEKLPS